MDLGIFVEDVLETLILDQDGLRKILKNDKLKFILQLQNLQSKDKSLDVVYYLGAVNNFIQNLGDLIAENEEKFDQFLLSSFTNDWDRIRCQLTLIGDIKRINPKLIDAQQYNYQEIINLKIKISNLYKKFENEYWNIRHAKYAQRVLNFHYLQDIQKISRTPYNNKHKKIVYLDTNIISYLMDDQNITSKFLKAKDKYDFCYSAYCIEDKVKQNSLMKIKNIKFIEALTDNLTAYRHNQLENLDVLFGYEPVKTVYDRVELWLEATEAREENEYTYYYYTPHNVHLDKKFNTYSIEQMLNHLNEIRLHEHFSNMTIIDKINYIFNLFNRMDFKRDSKNKSKIISSFQDKEHLTLAWKSNIFVSNDKKMLDRARVIYQFLDLDIKVMQYDEFIVNIDLEIP